jgi:hypothetical protein
MERQLRGPGRRRGAAIWDFAWRLGLASLGVIAACFMFLHPQAEATRVLQWITVVVLFVESVRVWLAWFTRRRSSRRQNDEARRG